MLLDPNILHIVLSIAGFALGWYLKRHPLDPALMSLLTQLQQSQQNAQAHSDLLDLLTHLPAKTPVQPAVMPVQPAAPKGGNP